MHNKTRILLLLLLSVILIGCQPDPRREAQAFAIRTEAEQDALNQAQQRTQDEELHQFRLQQEQVAQAHREAIAAEWRTGLNTLIRWSFKVGTFMVAVLIVALGIALSMASIGAGQAAAHAATLRARLIYLDRDTGQFPLLTYEGHGRYLLTDPNTKVTMQLDSRNEGDAQLIAGALAIRHTGVQTRNAAQAPDAASISQVQPLIIDGKDVTAAAMQMAEIGGEQDGSEV